jgi:hypothetical protein
VNFKRLLLANLFLIAITPTAWADDSGWQGFGASDEGGQLSLDMSSPQRLGGKNIVNFRYKNIRPDGTEWTRTAKTDKCFTGASWRLNGKPSGWMALVDERWLKVTTDSDAAKNMLINVCRIAGGERAISANRSAIKRDGLRISSISESNLPSRSIDTRAFDWHPVAQRELEQSTEYVYVDRANLQKEGRFAGFIMRRAYTEEQVVDSDEIGAKKYIEAIDTFIINCKSSVATLLMTYFISRSGSVVARYEPEKGERQDYPTSANEALAATYPIVCPGY